MGGGVIAGLVAASSGAAYLSPMAALVLGLAAGAIAAFVAGSLRRIDDPAHLFAIHGVGGAIGALLLPPLTMPLFGGAGFADGRGIAAHMIAQAVAIAVVAVWTAIVAFVILRFCTVVLRRARA